MKRSLFIIIFISLAAICWGAPPRLASETIFSRTEIKTDGHKFISNKSRDNYFRSVTAYNDKALLAEIKKQVLKDKSRASDVVEGYKDGKEYIILNIPNNGHTINVGFWWNANGYCHLFIQSELAAFE